MPDQTMSSFLLSLALLAVSATLTHQYLDDDLSFDSLDPAELAAEIQSPTRLLPEKITAYVGKLYQRRFPENFTELGAKLKNDHPLPPWILIDPKRKLLSIVPLKENVGKLEIFVSGTNGEEIVQKTTITVEEDDFVHCPDADETLLLVVLKKEIKDITPPERVNVLRKIRKFVNISDSSAFSIDPYKYDGCQRSVLKLVVGCDGLLWGSMVKMVSKVNKKPNLLESLNRALQLPVVMWEVKRDSRARTRRQVSAGSGNNADDYEESYYEEDYTYEDEELEGTTTQQISTTKSTTSASTHPHRHHHGESVDPDEIPINEDDADFEVSPTKKTTTSSPTTPIGPNAEIPLPGTSLPPAKDELPGDYDEEYDYETEYDETDLEGQNTLPINTSKGTTASTTSTSTTTTEATTTTAATSTTTTTVPTTTSTTTPSTTTTTSTQSTTSSTAIPIEYDDLEDYDDENVEGPLESKTEIPEITTIKSTTRKATTTEAPVTTTETIETTTISEEDNDDDLSVIIEDTEQPTVVYTVAMPTTTMPTTTTTTVATTTTTTVATTTTESYVRAMPSETTTTVATTTEQLLTTVAEKAATTTRDLSETIENEPKNLPPYIENRTKQMSVIAGKIFRTVVPQNAFNDLEDGYDLTLDFLNSKGEPLPKDSWCTFNPASREIYGLPLETDVSKWEYVLRATDKQGASISDRFTIQVQQHKAQRVVNHEFSLLMRIEKLHEFPHFVDWCLKTLRALGKIYNTNMSEITVRKVNYTGEPVIFTWTNDSLPTNHCPTGEIDELFKMLTANDRGDPSRELSTLLEPELRVKKVEKLGLGVCETIEKPPPSVLTPPNNFPPFLRNPIDRINATTGQLLVFKVPDDTFYDPEDTDPRALNITLLTEAMEVIPAGHWLQFDSKNREFYGIPKKSGKSNYHLVCTDSAGLRATDSLEIAVYPAPNVEHNVEFSITIATSFSSFEGNAAKQRKFVEKLQELFSDRNSSLIHLNYIKPSHDATIINWVNNSLSTAKCPHEEIVRLESILKNNEMSISSRVHAVMEPDFPVSVIKIIQTGNCKRASKPTPPIYEDNIILSEEKPPDAAAAHYQYLMTFIVPAIIISLMLFFAAVAACVLYRRRRSGKMNVEEDGRPSYGNKGIPVIFQEELEEKPEGGTKTPVILKDEKPPLAPPEYSKSGGSLTIEDEPYQPPPPFTRTQDGRQGRPKPTPTYRKPPPYVPP